jgi:hypothetical protein
MDNFWDSFLATIKLEIGNKTLDTGNVRPAVWETPSLFFTKI